MNTPRFFNTAGPMKGEEHYCLSPLERFDLEEVLLLIEQKKYFVLHAPWQSGKTSCLLALMNHLNQTDQYRCLYFSVEMKKSEIHPFAVYIRLFLNSLYSIPIQRQQLTHIHK